MQEKNCKVDGLKVLLDADGLYGASLFEENYKVVVPPIKEIDLKKIEGLQELVKVYYFEMRNSFALIEINNQHVSEENMNKFRKDMFESIAQVARKHALLECINGNPLQPSWLEYFQYQYNNLIPDWIKQSLLSIKFNVVHDGYMTSRVNADNVITVSSKLRAFLMVCNYLFLLFEEQLSAILETAQNSEADYEQLFRLVLQNMVFKPLLPYFLQPEYGLDILRLPVVLFNSGSAFANAIEITGAQIEFILMHELGHAFCNHNQSSEPRITFHNELSEYLFRNSNYELFQEYEADAFAVSCLQYWPREKIDFIYTGIEWLMCFLQCMNATANRSRELLHPGSIPKTNNFSLRREIIARTPVEFTWTSKDTRNRAVASTHIIIPEFDEYLTTITKDDINNTFEHRKKIRTNDEMDDIGNLYALYIN